MELYYSLALYNFYSCVAYEGVSEASLSGGVETIVKYLTWIEIILTWCMNRGQCLMGSLTGAVASQIVTEACKG